MTAIIIGAAWSLWWGILTSISPCPLASNIAAISYMSKKVTSTRAVLFSGLLYTLGRAAAYTLLVVILLKTLLSSGQVSGFLQKYLNMALGPLLILAGMFLLEMISLKISGPTVSEKMRRRVDRWGIWGSALLGFVFALSFCPMSAGYFFINLFGLLEKYGSNIMLPIMYGIGTALPVIVFALLISFSAQSIGKAFNKMATFELWARRITGVVFILVGIFYCLVHIFGLFSFLQPEA